MVDVNELNAQIKRKGYSTKEVFNGIGLSKRVWYSRISQKKFNSDEMYKLIKLLDIDNPTPIFFADEVT